jgi:hypothetical protein
LRFAPRALFITGALAATVAGASIALPPTAQAASGLQYHRGHYVQSGWYCYGWADGAYHCTQHWARTRSGKIISYNSNWVPNFDAPSPSTPRQYTPASHPTSQQSGSYNPGHAGIISEIRAVFGPYANQALTIAACESGFNPSARNPRPVGRAHAAGVFQILDTSTWYTTSYRGASPYNASANIHAAYEIFHRDGNSWREWACRP